MFTAGNLTDDQIKEAHAQSFVNTDDARLALYGDRTTEPVAQARARCAEDLNNEIPSGTYEERSLKLKLIGLASYAQFLIHNTYVQTDTAKKRIAGYLEGVR